MRAFCVFALLVCSVSAIVAQQANVQRIDITEHGLYTADTAKVLQPTEEGISRSTVDHVRLAVKTNTVPMQIGVQFGLWYTVVGSPAGANVPVRVRMVFPQAGLHPPGTSEPVLESPETDTVQIGKSIFTAYTLEEKWELVPGDWTFELWVGDRKLASQTFTVTP
jgi:hypothetical protein